MRAPLRARRVAVRGARAKKNAWRGPGGNSTACANQQEVLKCVGLSHGHRVNAQRVVVSNPQKWFKMGQLGREARAWEKLTQGAKVCRL